MNRIPLFLLSTFSGIAAAETVQITEGQEVSIPVHSAGITIQLPSYVRVVTPSREFQVSPIIPPQAPAQGQADAKQANDVRAFTINQIRGTSERITFMLADDRNVTIRFVPASTGDNFFDLRWITASRSISRTKADQGFLGSERAMMLAMLRDEPTMGRKVMSADILFDVYPQLDIKLLRTFQADGLTGYVFSFVNSTKKTIRVNPTVLSVGMPSRLILSQMDHETLKSCADDSSSDPRGTGCMSVVRIVVRGGVAGAMPRLNVDPRAQLPFMITQKEVK